MGFDKGYADTRLAEIDAEIAANKEAGKRLAERRKRYARTTGRAAAKDEPADETPGS